MKTWYTISAVVAVVALAAIVWAEPQAGGPGMMNNGPGREMIFRALMQHPELAQEVGLTEDKVSAIKDAVHEFRKSMVQARSEADLARLEVERLEGQDHPEEAALMKAIDAAGAKETAVRKAEAAFQIKVRGMIGEDVEKKIRERVRARLERGREGGPQDEMRPGAGGGEADGRPRPPWMQERMERPAERGAPAPDA